MKKSGLGPLELRVLSALSELKEASVKQVYDKLNGEVAITTVATVLDRLFKKGMLERKLVDEGRPYYIYRLSNEIINNKKTMGLIRDFLTAFREPLKFYFASNLNLSQEDIERIFRALDESS